METISEYDLDWWTKRLLPICDRIIEDEFVFLKLTLGENPRYDTSRTFSLFPHRHELGEVLQIMNMLIPMLHNIGRNQHGEILTQLAQLVDQDKIRPLLDSKLFNFSEVVAAHDRAESGQAIGKVTLDFG